MIVPDLPLGEAGPWLAAASGVKAFPDHAWSQQDDRANRHAQSMRSNAKRHKLPLGQLYRVFEEGVRARWVGSKGKPVDNHIVPFEIRVR